MKGCRQTRKEVLLDKLLLRARKSFNTIPDPLRARTKIALLDYLMSGLALFGLKCPSLLQFDKYFRNQGKLVKRNLKTLYGVRHVPSDTHFRHRLDQIKPRYLQKSMNTLELFRNPFILAPNYRSLQ